MTIVDDEFSGERILEIEVRGKRGVGYPLDLPTSKFQCGRYFHHSLPGWIGIDVSLNSKLVVALSRMTNSARLLRERIILMSVEPAFDCMIVMNIGGLSNSLSNLYVERHMQIHDRRPLEIAIETVVSHQLLNGCKRTLVLIRAMNIGKYNPGFDLIQFSRTEALSRDTQASITPSFSHGIFMKPMSRCG